MAGSTQQPPSELRHPGEGRPPGIEEPLETGSLAVRGAAGARPPTAPRVSSHREGRDFLLTTEESGPFLACGLESLLPGDALDHTGSD